MDARLRQLVAASQAAGHETESVHTLRMQGLDNGKLYQFAIQNFDICFSMVERIRGFTKCSPGSCHHCPSSNYFSVTLIPETAK